ncbi:MAG: hypothetical protein NXH78_00040 [Hyphomonadaceae bacterium]|nr:hypothetical protein [Hyphomonadaceae bacterium]
MSQLQLAANVALSACIAISIHSLFEPVNIRKRVAALKARMAGETYDGELKLPITLDTPIKAVLFGGTFMLLIGLIAFAALSQFSISPVSALWVITGILIGKELINTLQVDAYHVEIGEVIDSVAE